MKIIGLSAFLFLSIHAYDALQVHLNEKNKDLYQWQIDIPLEDNDAFYAEYFDVGVDHPDVTITSWNLNESPQAVYDSSFKQTKSIITKPIQLTINSTINDIPDNAHLHVTYYRRSDGMQHEHLSIPVKKQEAINNIESIESPKRIPNQSTQTIMSSNGWCSRLCSCLQTTTSLTLKLVFAFLLGLLLSLTPCIYPMLPLTMGILHKMAGTSVMRNMLLAFIYALGVATMFAILGTFAAFTGRMFGELMHSQFFVIVIIILLAYLAGSLLSFYELYIPSFLKPKPTEIKKGSLLSVFACGAASGTIVSPCVSPGLVLLLTVASTMGSMLSGFMLLFSFGIGLSIPLLVAGAFSTVLKKLPKAGQWMKEVQYLLGWLILGVCIRYTSCLLPWYTITWIITIVIFCAGYFYLKKGHSIIGTLLIAASVFSIFQGFKATMMYYQQQNNPPIHWFEDFDRAVHEAQAQQKKILIKFGAPICSLCSQIDRKLFEHPTVIRSLQQVIPVKITNPQLFARFKVRGAPTVILMDADEQELKRWGGELIDASPETFSRQISN